mgnify:CR=1 FL=1
MSRTLAIIKPDATERHLAGHIISRFERAGFNLVAMRLVCLSESQVREFYSVHEGKPFLDDLVEFMVSGPVVPMVLEKEDAVSDLRMLIGATNPAEAACGTLRQEIGLNVQANSVHASDSDENAVKEIAFFFSE